MGSVIQFPLNHLNLDQTNAPRVPPDWSCNKCKATFFKLRTDGKVICYGCGGSLTNIAFTVK